MRTIKTLDFPFVDNMSSLIHLFCSTRAVCRSKLHDAYKVVNSHAATSPAPQM